MAEQRGKSVTMKLRLWLPICVASLWACVVVYPAAALSPHNDDCFDVTLEPTVRAPACLVAAENGDAVAQSVLGFMYANGQGVSQDSAQAVVWLRRAAEQGFAAAQINLGTMYTEGRGVPQDNAQALIWYRRAAEQGLAAAQHNLGVMHTKGQGMPQDYTLAHMWLNLAGAGGYEDAAKIRDTVAAQMTPAQIAEAQRLAREWTEAHRAGAE